MPSSETHKPEERLTIQEAAELALREIDGMFKYFLVSGLSEEGGGLPLYEQSKGLADARASLAAALAQDSEPPTHTPVGASDEGEWPVLSIAHEPSRRRYHAMPLGGEGRVVGWNRSYQTETYYPASHPAVLSPEEARLLTKYAMTPNLIGQKVLARLSSYAQKEEG